MATGFSKVDPKTAWRQYEPSKDAPWDLQKVGHLYRRAAFGATWEQLQAGLRAGPDQAIDSLLKGGENQQEFDRLTAPLAHSIGRVNNGPQASAWWLYRIVYGPHPLREKLTLFWHNHFATSNAKVQNAGFILRQYALLQRHALGSFRRLCQEISIDPAMLIWLDARLSKKGMPNENYARELMELFTLGIGNYTETDIREAARAFTGWEIQGAKDVVLNREQHDDEDKTVLGKKGNWESGDIVRICLEQPAAPIFIVRKLYRFLISESQPPTSELLEPLARQYRESDFDTGALVATMLRSNHFFSLAVYRAMVKSPVDFALSIVRGLEGRPSTIALARCLLDLGQNLFYPPSVKGWDGGSSWLNGQTLLSRNNLALALTSTEDARFGKRADPAVVIKKQGIQSEAEAIDFWLRLFLQGDVPAESRKRLVDYEKQSASAKYPFFWSADDITSHRARALCHLVLTLPEFQLA
jgi:hypothetical protein